MKSYLKTGVTIICGLIVFQLTAFLNVYMSNIRLVRTMELALGEGYLAVPNALILPGLKGPGMAMAGGLFFTLTMGALVTLLSLGASMAFRAWPAENRIKIPVGSGLLLILLAWMNQDGFLFMESLGIILTVAMVFALDHLFSKGSPRGSTVLTLVIHMAFPSVLALVLLVFSQGKDNRLFSDFRDAFLMNNPVGMTINDFYYRFTPSATAVLNPQSSKLIKSVTIDAQAPDKIITRRIERRLMVLGYLPLAGMPVPDLRVEYHEGELRFFSGNRLLMTTTFQNFIKKSSSLLKEISQKEDRYGPYRILMHTGLFTGFPLLMYLILHMALFCPAAIFLSPSKAAFAASGTCFALGACAFGLLSTMNPVILTASSIPHGLSSPDPATRLATLRLIDEKELDIMAYPEAEAAFQSPSVAERYWAARASAHSPNPKTCNRLLTLLADPNLNVQTQACYALGRSRNKKAREPILAHITTTPHWYVQCYAYNALQRLGWTQKKSAP